MSEIKEPEVDVYVKIFGILQFRLFPIFSKWLGGNPNWNNLNEENWYDFKQESRVVPTPVDGFKKVSFLLFEHDIVKKNHYKAYLKNLSVFLTKWSVCVGIIYV